MLSSPDWKLTLVTNRQVSLQCPITKHPCSAQPMSIPAMLNGCAQPQGFPAVPNHQVSVQCPTAEYPCSAQPQSIPAVSNHQISVQGPTEKVSLQCLTAEYPWGAQQPEYKYSCSAFAVLQGRQLRGGRETLHFLCNNGFRVGMLEVNNHFGGPTSFQLGFRQVGYCPAAH